MPKLIANKLSGSLTIPPSKSLTHRALICSALGSKRVKISNILYSEDIKATISSLRALGSEIIEGKDYLEVIPHPITKCANLDANESGSTLRFMIPLMLLQPEKIQITGHNKLKTRPLTDYIKLFNEHDIDYEYQNELPLTLKGSLKSGIYHLSGDKSSQFISGLLFALPLLEADSEIILDTPLESVEYVNMTIKVMEYYGVKIQTTATGYFIKGNQKYLGKDYIVPADFSQAAFFLAANFLGAQIKIKGLECNKLQGDERIIQILEAMGATFDKDYLVIKKTPKAIDISLKNEPDLAPILASMATSLDGVSVFRDLKRLEYKESNRLIATRDLINSLGGKAIIKDYNLYVYGNTKYHSGSVLVHNDHRILMTAAIMALMVDEVLVDDLKPVNKSFPNFFAIYRDLGGKIYE